MDVSTGRGPRRMVALTCCCGRILHPGFFLENFDGLIGSIGVAVLKNGLKPETDIAFVVSPLRSEESSPVVDLVPRLLRILGMLQLVYLRYGISASIIRQKLILCTESREI